MQILPCPFCGPRDEIEFHYVGEPKSRPEPNFGGQTTQAGAAPHPGPLPRKRERGKPQPAGSVSDAEWAEYLWFNDNPKGHAREVWLHLTCMEMFALTRDTAVNATVSSEAATRPAP